MQDRVRQSAAIMPRWLSIIRHCISLITCCALVVFVVILWQQRTAYLRWEAELSHTLELRSRIAELDQVLTVNAILSAATGDPKWPDIYRENEPVLDRVLQEAHARLSDAEFAADAGGLEGVDTTSIANVELVEMEHRAISLAEAGELAVAVQILASDEYGAAKARYTAGLQSLGDALQRLAENKGRELAQAAYWMALSAICLLLLICAYATLMFAGYRTQARIFQGEFDEQRERLELAVKSADLVLWDWNIVTGELIFSDSFASQMGYELRELRPHVSTWQELLHPADKPSALAAADRALANPDSQYEDRFRLRSKDGTWNSVIARGRVVARTANGSPARMIGTCLDVSKQVQLEAQLMQGQRLESIGQLAAGIAHEINTPMQFVGDNIQFLYDCCSKLFEVVDAYEQNLVVGDRPKSWQERRDEVDAVMQRNQFDRIRHQVPQAIAESIEGIQRVINIVRAMKEFSHPGRELKVGVDLNNAVQSTVTITRNRWKYVAELELDLDPNLPTVTCTPAEINQVLLNLIVNSADAVTEKYGENSGEKGVITVRTRATQGSVSVEVEDTGCGIPQEIRNRVFDPFFTTKEVGKGTGQGLTISYNVIVNKHGGTLEVESMPGVGTTFRVCLPLQPQVATADWPVPAPIEVEERSSDLLTTASVG
jgi:signal transduction histidine kinase